MMRPVLRSVLAKTFFLQNKYYLEETIFGVPKPSAMSAETNRIRLNRGAHPSMRAAIVETIRTEILRGHLKPGSRIALKAVAFECGAAVSVLREALCQLAADGLVIAEEQRGFWVAPVSMSDLRDLVRRRVEVETSALRLAIELGDNDWESQIVGALHKLSRTPKFTAEWIGQHRVFHDALVAACGSQWLMRFHGMLHESSERYRQLAGASPERKADIDGEHAAIADAAINRDPDLACTLMTQHVSEMQEILLRIGIVQE